MGLYTLKVYQKTVTEGNMMSEYKVLLFDLDGTLSDPKVGITKSVQYALNKLGIVEQDLNKLEDFIGPPLQESFSAFYRLNQQEIAQAIEFYRERFIEMGMFENELYSDIPNLLKELKEKQFVLIVATSKPTMFAKDIIKYFQLDGIFERIVGSNLDGTMSSKTEIIQYILDEYKEFSSNHFIMIGDRMHDIIGANNTNIDSLAVSYGYGSSMELKNAKPTYMVHSVKELRDFFKVRQEIKK